jgi:hypothetical protein
VQANPDELNLGVGDIIQVLGEVEEGWWKGQKGKQLGVFPSNFVVEVTPPLPPKPGTYGLIDTSLVFFFFI